MPEKVVDLSNSETKRKVIAYLTGLTGRYRIGITKHRERRSDRQNRYYHPCFVLPFFQWLRENGYDVRDPDEAHEMLKGRFLGKTLTDPETGEILSQYPGSTKVLDTAQFNAYLDECARWLAEFCQIVVPEPSEYHER